MAPAAELAATERKSIVDDFARWPGSAATNPLTIALVAAVGSLCTVLAPVLADNVIGAGEWPGVVSALVLAAGTVAAVWRVPNKLGAEAPTPPVVPSAA